MLNQLLSFVLSSLTENALQRQGVKHVFIGNVNLLFDFPRLSLAVGAPVVSIRNNFKVGVTKNSFALFTLFRVVKRDGVTDRTDDEFMLKEDILADPLFVDGDELGLILSVSLGFVDGVF